MLAVTEDRTVASLGFLYGVIVLKFKNFIAVKSVGFFPLFFAFDIMLRKPSHFQTL